MTTDTRPTLGPMMHATCFQYLRLGAEDVVGRVPIMSAGRHRGQDVVKELGLAGQVRDPGEMLELFDRVLGVEGTRLCLVRDVSARPGGGYEVRLVEGACTMGQQSAEPLCAYTLGVFVGAVQALTAVPMRGRETECQAVGHAMCVYEIDPV